MATPPLPPDAATVIADPARAAAELLIEAFAGCHMPYSNLIIESLAGIIEFGDVDGNGWYPADEADGPGGADRSDPAGWLRR